MPRFLLAAFFTCFSLFPWKKLTLERSLIQLLGLCPAKNTGQNEREHNKDGNMKIIVLHFTPEDYDIERFVELTDVKIDNLIDFEFEVYDHNEVY